MPIINISVTGKSDAKLSAAIAREATDITAKLLRKDPTITAVAVNFIDPQHWFAGGKSLAEHGISTFWLDIKVVDGTNTKLELEAYLKAIFEAFGRLLGGVHEESYAFVHEVPAAAYGYGGKSQEFRFISGRLKAA
ncbi:4-oxalocrotonate tautomerase family protein [Mesorhizobium sp. B1-1-5]|uniref:tautomerase family protein n=1 Tax=Mesorhizobium sp. B1-1-5 TaxID=2589979 RepID=UPI00112AF61A|nr:4-oxalocrotonate tautomerase family protein [Mesorhizobium sp. B1-1-5]TPO01039.1 4-oxalocrotonate tautomerase family protein [Mesorhizobium sp. B1-1-5]